MNKENYHDWFVFASIIDYLVVFLFFDQRPFSF